MIKQIWRTIIPRKIRNKLNIRKKFSKKTIFEEQRDDLLKYYKKHKTDDEKKIRKKLNGYDIETSEGYMIFGQLNEWKAPYFRRGLIRAIKKN